MVITMFVMPPFTYHNLPIHSYAVITVFYNLQLFLCPTNEDVTRVHYDTSLDVRTSSVLMTFEL
jgi:accessory gene regulator protein AgrB